MHQRTANHATELLVKAAVMQFKVSTKGLLLPERPVKAPSMGHLDAAAMYHTTTGAIRLIKCWTEMRHLATAYLHSCMT